MDQLIERCDALDVHKAAELVVPGQDSADERLIG